jgi:hypothetical protein
MNLIDSILRMLITLKTALSKKLESTIVYRLKLLIWDMKDEWKMNGE